jgi:multidrug resistance efflux pump
MLRLSPQSPIDEKVYKDKLNSSQVLYTPQLSVRLAHWLLGIFLVVFVVFFLPWQQNIQSEGELTAFSPADRPQTVETAIAGRVEEWRIREGQFVNKGDTLVKISEIRERFFDPELLLRLQEQIEAKNETIKNKLAKADALTMQVNALEMGLKFKLEQIEQKIIQSILKVESDSNDLIAAQVDLAVQERQISMFQTLFDSGLVALTRLEEAKIKAQSSRAKIVAAQNKFDASKNELVIATIERSTTEAEARDKISKSQAERSATLAEVYESQESLAKLRNEYANMSIRNQQYYILAPQNGYIVKALKNGIGETVKDQEALLTIMPEKPQMAVALYVKAMDVPLLSVGRHVRIEFDGWPALQFTGWPSVSVGTFGGKIAVIDQVNMVGGKYRVLVVPDTKGKDGEWPKELRLGSGVYGWVMLDDVPVYFEIWRQLNGFPPSLQSYQGDDGGVGKK